MPSISLVKEIRIPRKPALPHLKNAELDAKAQVEAALSSLAYSLLRRRRANSARASPRTKAVVPTGWFELVLPRAQPHPFVPAAGAELPAAPPALAVPPAPLPALPPVEGLPPLLTAPPDPWTPPVPFEVPPVALPPLD